MKSRAIQTALILVTVVGMAGCQSGPRWAWWAKDTPSEDSSLVARSAPALPSTQAAPQGVTAAATPPSANSVAAVRGTPPGTPVSVPATSSATIAAAPTATYPTTAAPSSGAMAAPAASAMVPPLAVSTPSQAVTAAAANAAATPRPPGPPSGVAVQTGPYDPNAYRQSGSTIASSDRATSSSDDDRYRSADQYAVMPATPAIGGTTSPDSDPSADRYAHTPLADDDRYGSSAVERYAVTPTTSTAGVAATSAQPAAPSPSHTAVAATPSNPPAAISAPAATPSSAAAPNAAATVRLGAPAGQYRPGGTSSFTGLGANSVEVASRPTNALQPPTVPAMPTAPSAPANPPGNPLRTY